LTITLETFTLGAGVPSIKFDWGDGTIEEVQAAVSIEIAEGLYGNYYSFYHAYDSLGDYVVSYTDSFWVSDILNLDEPGSQYFRLEEKVGYIEGVLNNPPIIQFASPEAVRLEEDGSVSLSVSYNEFDGDEVVLRFRDFPGEGYFLPPATDTLICCIDWQVPPGPGRYVFAMEAADFRFGEELSSSTLLMALEVPAASNAGEAAGQRAFRLYPNPASETLYLSFGEPLASPAELRVFSLAGQEAYRAALPGGLAGQAWEIPVAGWPAGVYVVRVIAGGRSWVERVIKR
jgi:hypothetical protein